MRSMTRFCLTMVIVMIAGVCLAQNCVDWTESIDDLSGIGLLDHPSSIALDQDHVLVKMPGTLQIYDLATPASPALEASMVLEGDIMTSGGQLAAVASGALVTLVDWHSPASPIEVGTFIAEAEVTALHVSGDLLVAALSDTRIVLYDISQPGVPAVLGEVALSDAAVSLDLANNRLLASTSSAVASIDVSDTAAPTLDDSWTAAI